MPHRILHIIPNLDLSGTGKQLVLLARGLPASEFEVHVCALGRTGPLHAELSAAGIPVSVIGKRWEYDPAAFWRLRRHIAALQPDLAHTWLFAANAYGRAAGRAAGVRRLVASERVVERRKAWHELALDRRLARRTDRIVANSLPVRDFCIEQGIAAGKLVVIPNGVRPPQPSDLTRELLLEELELPRESRLIAVVGRLCPQNRFKDLIWAADILKIIRNDFHVLVLGEGPQRSRLERYRDDVRIGDRVHFLGERGDVPRILPHCEVLWFAGAWEGTPNVVMEAMASGLPVVASDTSVNRDLVVPGATGFLVGAGDRPAFAKRANQILEDRDLAQRLGQAARQRMLEEFSVEKMVDRHAVLYRELLD